LAIVRKKKRVQEALQALREGFQEAGTPITEATIDFATNAMKSPRFLQLLAEQTEQLGVASVVAAVLSEARKKISISLIFRPVSNASDVN
jgi:hypothetical protein